MNDLQVFHMASAVFAAALPAVAVWCFRLRPDRLERAEKLPRNRVGGLVLGWAALIWCIPHAAAVAPGILLPWLWPIALVGPVLCFFYLDFLLARSVAGLMILSAYFFIHASFERHSPGAPVLAVLGWSWGICGIWCSGKPAAMRDWIRRCCRSSLWRGLSCGYLVLLAAAVAAAAFLTRGGN